jgi:hypothetical protein
MLPATVTRRSAWGRALTRFRAERQPDEAAFSSPLPNEFGIVLRCAVTSERFKMMFRRGHEGRYFPAGQVRIEPFTAAGVRGEGASTLPVLIQYDVIAHWPEDPCPCCRRRFDYQRPHVLCGRCGALVCTGRTHRSSADGAVIFTCHDGCGVRDQRVAGPIVRYAAEPDRPPCMPVIKVRANGRI